MRPQSDATRPRPHQGCRRPGLAAPGRDGHLHCSPRKVAVLPVVGSVVAAASTSGLQDVLCVLGKVVTKMGELDKIGEKDLS